MKTPVEHVKISARGREILIKIKRATGIEHWNEICRIALCRSLANPTLPSRRPKTVDSNIDMEWKTFAGQFQQELTALTIIRANKDKINIADKINLTEYFRDHLERGIASMQNIKSIKELGRSIEHH